MLRSRNLRVLIITVAFCGALAIVAAVSAQPGSSFVSRSGTQLRLAGARWRFVAFNDYQLTSAPGAYTCGQALDDTRLDGIMQEAANAGAKVIRTWFFQSYYDLDQAGAPMAPSYAAFDRVLDAADRHGLEVVPVLVNQYPQCEPGSSAKDLAFFSGGYTQPQDGYPLSFKAYAETIAAHYASDPRIAFWEIGNELSLDTAGGACSAAQEQQGSRALRTFADAMTAAIKGADPHHLVALGTQGTGQCGLEGRDYSYVDGGRVDICEYHDYADVTHSIPTDGTNRLRERIAECAALRKPMFVGESGINADVADNGTASGRITTASLQLRAGFFDAKLSAAFGAGVSGYAIWALDDGASDSPYNLPSGGYQVGPADPTLAVTAAVARTFGAFPGTVRSSFEDGTVDGWVPVSGSGQPHLSVSTAEAWGGTRSLQVQLGGGHSQAVVLPLPSRLRTGSTVTLHLYMPSTAAPGLQAAPYVSRDRGAALVDPRTTLQPGWNVIAWRVPAGARSRPASLGLGITDPAGWTGALFLDDVAWSGVGVH